MYEVLKTHFGSTATRLWWNIPRELLHIKFAPRCAVCGKGIVPQEGEKESVRVVAMDKSFHPDCYKCEDCGLLLSSKVEGAGCYPLDSHLYCKTCNSNRLRMQATA
ncbi:LIM domain protein [Ancylostoma duodenale]|uniref:LIM domain protein n=1 Tax=Ancylostoma duodenale TaxID=51022 RepID=A0A0C2CKK7_9BILA|nr:LIM domain protein [Ancylostoma duodenale]